MYKRINLYIVLIALMICSSGCKQDQDVPTVDPVEEIVNKVRASDRLYTTEYRVRKIVTYDDVVKLKGSLLNKKFDFKVPLGDRKILIPMEAIVKGYVDFSDFGPENVMVDSINHTIRITLPDPEVEITSTKIDHKNVKEFTNRGRSRFSEAEMSNYEKQGVAAIANAIPEYGIIETTRLHAYNTLMPLIEQMGYAPEQVTIDFRNDYSRNDLLNIIKLNKD